MTTFFQKARSAEIVFKQKAKCDDEWINISDIAVIRGSDKEKLLMKEMFFGKAPKDGEPKVISVNYLKRRLKQFGFENATNTIFYPTSSITVLKGDSKNRVDEIARECEVVLMTQFQEFSRIDVELEDPENLLDNLPKGLISVDLPSKKLLPSYSSTTSLYVEVTIGEKIIKGYFKAHIKMYRREVIAKRNIRGRIKMDEKLLQLKDCEVLEGKEKGFSSIEELIGSQLNYTKITGRRIIESDLRPKILIKKDQKIRLNMNTNNIQMSLWVTAIKDGFKDEIISFKTNANRFVRAKVVGENKAEFIDKSTDKKVINVGKTNKPSKKTISVGGKK